MRSIRLSLLVYFLVLLALALGAVSILVYQLTQQSVQARERDKRPLLEDRYESLRKNTQSGLDNVLLSRAQKLANLAQWPWGRSRYRGLYPLGLLSAGLSPQGFLLTPLWLAEVVEGPLTYKLHRTTSVRAITEADQFQAFALPLGLLSACPSPQGHLLVPGWISETAARPLAPLLHHSPVRLTFADDILPGDAEDQGWYCQIGGESGSVWQCSRSLGDNYLELPPETDQLAMSRWLFDELDLAPGSHVRRVVYKAPMPRYHLSSSKSRRPSGSSGRSTSAAERVPPAFVIQCASDTKERDAALAGLKSDLDRDLAELSFQSESTLAALRNRLLWISLVTFATSMVGGFCLVRLGLSPLHRLSEAVSRISEKDFRLQVEEASLPAELRPIAGRLSQTLLLLKRAFSREKQAAADISHELRTPLSALMTTIEVALRKSRTPEEYRELLKDCRATGQEMSRLVERLLSLARLDAGVDTLRPQEVDVATLAEQCVALVRPLAEARDLSLRVRSGERTRVNADPDKLREVLTSLLHNAIEYNRPQGNVEVAVARHNGHLEIEVCDTGIGIDPKARQHIFERFYRADPSRQADGLHAGLGLAIVKGYVDLMGGTIAVESIEGQGSTFRVDLPVR